MVELPPPTDHPTVAAVAALPPNGTCSEEESVVQDRLTSPTKKALDFHSGSRGILPSSTLAVSLGAHLHG